MARGAHRWWCPCLLTRCFGSSKKGPDVGQRRTVMRGQIQKAREHKLVARVSARIVAFDFSSCAGHLNRQGHPVSSFSIVCFFVPFFCVASRQSKEGGFVKTKKTQRLYIPNGRKKIKTRKRKPLKGGENLMEAGEIPKVWCGGDHVRGKVSARRQCQWKQESRCSRSSCTT